MTQFLLDHITDIIVIVVIIAGLIILYKKNRKDLVKKIILSLVVQAEKHLGSGTGELKYAYVIEKFYKYLPSVVRLLYSKKEIDTMIEEAVSKLKEMLSDGVNLSSYDDEMYINALKK